MGYCQLAHIGCLQGRDGGRGRRERTKRLNHVPRELHPTAQQQRAAALLLHRNLEHRPPARHQPAPSMQCHRRTHGPAAALVEARLESQDGRTSVQNHRGTSRAVWLWTVWLGVCVCVCVCV